MAVRIFQNGGMVEIKEDGKQVELIPSRSFHFEIEPTYVLIRDLDKKDYSKNFAFADVKDQAGAALPVVGTIDEDVKDYLAPFVGFNVPGGAGSTTFLALLDTFSSFLGNGGKVLAVNAGETAIEAINPVLSSRTHIELDQTDDGRVFGNDEWARVDTTGAADTRVDLYLPSLASVTNFQCWASKSDATANIVRIHADGSDTINGAAFVDITIDDGAIGFMSFGPEWVTF